MSLAPPFEAIDSALFDVGDRRIRLARIIPVGRSAVCLDDEGRRFACGLMARATLQNFLARHEVICLPLFTAKDKRHDFIEADCHVEGVDIAEHVVRSGFAFPATLAGSRLERALVAARDERAGVWRGPYLVPETDPAVDDAGEVEISSLRTVSSVGGEVDTTGTDGGRRQAGPVAGGVRIEAAPGGGKGRPRAKGRPLAERPDPDPTPRPQAPVSRPAGPRNVSSVASELPRSGVVAGPILPPPEALARKLGVAPSTSGGEPSDPVRGPTDR